MEVVLDTAFAHRDGLVVVVFVHLPQFRLVLAERGFHIAAITGLRMGRKSIFEVVELRFGDIELERGNDFDAFITSESDRVESEVVFAGYGISAP